MAITVSYCGGLDLGQSVVQPYHELGSLVADLIKPMPYVEQQGSFDAGFLADRLHYWNGALLWELDERTIEVLVQFTRRMPSAMSRIGLHQVHGAASRVPREATAFPHRFDFWDAPSWHSGPILPTPTHTSPGHATLGGARPARHDGVYVNNLGVEGQDRERAAYGDNYSRLAALKAIYDPDNRFRLNQNNPTCGRADRHIPHSVLGGLHMRGCQRATC